MRKERNTGLTIAGFAVVMVSFLSGCVHTKRPLEPPPPPPPPPSTGASSSGGSNGCQVGSQDGNSCSLPIEKKTFLSVRVSYATDRASTAVNPTSYNGSRGSLVYGTCDVNIPPDHRLGEIERPSIFRWHVRDDPKLDVMLIKTSPMSRSAYLAYLKGELASTDDGSALLFVHGYNVSFQDAALRTAQMAYDLQFNGPAMFFSWPSQGSSVAYPQDETNVQWATPDLENFLLDILQTSEIKNLYVIAHSMGNRAVTDAIRNVFASHPQLRSKVREVVLAAPDIDADVFKTQVLPPLIGTKNDHTHVTLYASSKDEALVASKRFHGYARAGDSENIVLASGLESIDATAVDTGLVGHSYFGDSRSVISDIYNLLHEHARACHRFALQQKITEIGTFCVIRP